MTTPSTARGRTEPPGGAAPARRLRGVKIAVIAMGAVIVIGFIVVVATIVQRLAGPERPAELGVIGVPAAAGCWIADAWSAEGRLYLRLDGAEGCRQVAIVDEARRAVVGLVVTVEPGAEAMPQAVPALPSEPAP